MKLVVFALILLNAIMWFTGVWVVGRTVIGWVL